MLWLLDDGVAASATGSIALAWSPAVAGWRGAATGGATTAADGASTTGPACGVTLGGASFTPAQPAAKPRRRIAIVRTAV